MQVAGIDEVASDTVGSTSDTVSRTLTAHVALGELTPDQVRVQALMGPVGPGGDISDPAITEMTPSVEVDRSGRTLFTAVVTPERSGRYGYTARALPCHPQLSDDAELGLVRYPASTAEDAGPGTVENVVVPGANT